MKFKTIYESNCALGSYNYRVTSDGVTCNLQARKTGNVSWYTSKKISQLEWEFFNNKHGVTSNPAFIDKLIHDDTEE